MSEGKYQIGDVVHCDLHGLALGSMATEGCFIGHLKADTKSRVLILATAAEVGIEIDAEHYRSGSSDMGRGEICCVKPGGASGVWKVPARIGKPLGLINPPDRQRSTAFQSPVGLNFGGSIPAERKATPNCLAGQPAAGLSHPHHRLGVP